MRPINHQTAAKLLKALTCVAWLVLAASLGQGVTAKSRSGTMGSGKDKVPAKADDYATCSERCTRHCKGTRDVKTCVRRYVAERCSPFSARVRSAVEAKCRGSFECQQRGETFCFEDSKCVHKLGQCCTSIDCLDSQHCLGNLCTALGRPSITLLWTGTGTYLGFLPSITNYLCRPLTVYAWPRS